MKVIQNVKLGICIPPITTTDTIVEVGSHKHMLLVSDPQDKNYVIAYGYLTNKNSGILMGNKQF
jgi:hypothetical protein